MSCNPSPFPRAALAEATRIAPDRNRDSDGICPSNANHQRNPTSDHEPDSRGIPHAFDTTQDAARFNAHAYGDQIALRVLAHLEWRVKYLVSWNYQTSRNKIIDFSIGDRAWRDMTEAETRDDPHLSHLHTSFIYTLAAEDSIAPYFGGAAPTNGPSSNLEDTMVLYPLKTSMPGRVMFATLDAGRKVVMLFNGAGLRGDLAVGNHREWKVPSNYPLTGMTASGTRDPHTNLIVPDGKGVIVVDAVGETYEPFWS